jgi:hypothetical protein
MNNDQYPTEIDLLSFFRGRFSLYIYFALLSSHALLNFILGQ